MTDSSDQNGMGHSISLQEGGINVARRGAREIVSFNQAQSADTATGASASELTEREEDI